MSFNIISTERFRREAKKLVKKYPSLKSELIQLQAILSQNPTAGVALGGDVYKIRLGIASKGKGKSGGARAITLVKVIKKTIYLVSIYDKSEIQNLAKDQIAELLRKTGLAE